MVIIARGIPETNIFHDKTYKASLTGVTRLKEGKYRCRYRVAPGYQVTAQGYLTVKPKKKTADRCGKVGKSVDKESDEPLLQQGKPDRKKTYGIAKQTVKNRMRAMVNMLRHCTDRMRKPKLYFFTVTFQAGTADDICYQALNTWLTVLRQRKLLLSYLWVAERQKNGTIHFHMAVPHYMNAKLVNRKMKNVLLDLRGKGLLPGWERWEIAKYNGVDIAKNRDTKRPVNFAAGGKDRALVNYLTKYITKNETTMLHLAWHCSRDWSALVLGMTFTRNELKTFVKGRNLEKEPLHTEYCEFYRWNNYKPPERFAQHLANINYDVLFFVTGKQGEFLFSTN
jgi:hypothetical protein